MQVLQPATDKVRVQMMFTLKCPTLFNSHRLLAHMPTNVIDVEEVINCRNGWELMRDGLGRVSPGIP
jgi:hypothetical protein